MSSLVLTHLSPSYVTNAQLYQRVQALAPLDARIWVLLTDDIAGVHNFWKVASPILSINTYFMGIRYSTPHRPLSGPFCLCLCVSVCA